MDLDLAIVFHGYPVCVLLDLVCTRACRDIFVEPPIPLTLLLVVLERMIDVIADREFLDLPVGSHRLIRAEEVGNRTEIDFKTAVDRNRRAKRVIPIETVAQASAQVTVPGDVGLQLSDRRIRRAGLHAGDPGPRAFDRHEELSVTYQEMRQ